VGFKISNDPQFEEKPRKVLDAIHCTDAPG
jgi:hypothetical protein